ncbi:HEAT repeat domain-containing protein [Peptostreptococcus canis]|uniref:HEAT repeat domain-containing protein n=1 Tax=Peptostreptococcus canis TaxID=1159213 RepID=A0ABR6TJN1_9FIRM|nr:HEAT repeat domain-containing protein [Peptostreptococcus canis]MBC2575394.1 HEAT repeat domain-containing protein [Peptostreptococcus canis]MBP1997422.1 HEAT repeat protein [Peptostreptococcus canis]
MVIRWENVDSLEDYFITYLLYLDSLTVPQISRIRNKSIEEINDDLIKAKMYIRLENKKSDNKEDILTNYLSMSKDERLLYMSDLSDDKLESFKRLIYRGILKINNIDDLMILVWTAGEFRDDRFLNIIYPFIDKPHSNIRRISYSAIGKIANKESIQYLEMGLSDSNPQIRQYCAKYLGIIGNRNSIRILENFVKNKSNFEKEYVLKACRDSICNLYSKFNINK